MSGRSTRSGSAKAEDSRKEDSESSYSESDQESRERKKKGLSRRFDVMDSKFNIMDSKFNTMESELSRLSAAQNEMNSRLISIVELLTKSGATATKADPRIKTEQDHRSLNENEAADEMDMNTISPEVMHIKTESQVSQSEERADGASNADDNSLSFYTPDGSAVINKSVSANASTQKEVYITHTQHEFKAELHTNELSPIGIFNFLAKKEDFEFRYNTNVNIARCMHKDVRSNFSEFMGIHKDSTNREVLEMIMEHIHKNFHTNKECMEFLGHRDLIKTKVLSDKAQDRLYQTERAIAMLQELLKAYRWIANAMRHNEQQGHLNLEIFPAQTARPGQKVINIFTRTMKTHHNIIYSNQLENIIAQNSKSDFNVVAIKLLDYFTANLPELRQAKQTESKFQQSSPSYEYNKYNKREGGKPANQDYKPNYIARKEIANIDMNEKDMGNSNEVMYEEEIESEDDLSPTETMQQEEKKNESPEEVNAIEEKRNPCLIYIESGACTKSECPYDHELAANLRQYAKRDNVMSALNKANTKGADFKGERSKFKSNK